MPGTMIYTDESVIYGAVPHLVGMGYQHKRINHSQKVYVVGDVHTNTIEGFWSLVKRGIGGVYHSVSAKYLQSYLDEYSFRYNRRDSGNDFPRAFGSGKRDGVSQARFRSREKSDLVKNASS